jgi:cytochrome c556
MRTDRILGWVAAAMIVGAAGVAVAADMAAVVKERQAHYKTIGAASKGIFDELNKPSPSVAVVQGYAKTLDTLAPQIPTWFPVGSGAEAGVKTAAKPEIWSNASGFAAAAAQFATAAHTFDQIAAAGDVSAMKAGFPTMAKACGNCHMQFRAKE